MLFIGGSHDGERLHAELRPWRIFKKHRFPVSISAVEAPEAFSVEAEFYLPMPFRGVSKEFFVMAIEGMTADEVIERLIDKYTPATIKEVEEWRR